MKASSIICYCKSCRKPIEVEASRTQEGLVLLLLGHWKASGITQRHGIQYYSTRKARGTVSNLKKQQTVLEKRGELQAYCILTKPEFGAS